MEVCGIIVTIYMSNNSLPALITPPVLNILKDCLNRYTHACRHTDWVKDEIYKFEFAYWLSSRINFETQTDQEILDLCIQSQQQKYSGVRGVNFLQSAGKAQRSVFITLADIQLFRKVAEGNTLTADDFENRGMSFTGLAGWLGTIFPEQFVPVVTTEQIETYGRIWAIPNLPQKAYNGFITNQPYGQACVAFIKQYGAYVAEIFKEKLNIASPLFYNWLAQDFSIFIKRQLIDKNNFPPFVSDGGNGSTNKTMTPYPLNTILYGPPGTGKTYSTKQYALQIIEGLTEAELKQKYPTRESVNIQFAVYQERKQVEFVTFHQSFSYEDFIEGIKPVLPGAEAKEEEESLVTTVGEIAYELVPGIFKNICGRAESYTNYDPAKESDNFKNIISQGFGKANFYKMSIGNTALAEDDQIFQYCLANDCLALGWGGSIDFRGAKDRKAVKSLLGKDDLERSTYETTAVKTFVVDMKEGDFVFVSSGNYKIRAIGQISGEYYLQKDSPVSYSQFRKVKWLNNNINLPVTEVYNKGFTQRTIYSLNKGLIKKAYFTSDSEKGEPDEFRKNHVLIIDEINRGNVSQIFGELITLIETDKRAGNTEQLKVSLPYSKDDDFSVPQNLYLLGTMNTADRSVEALDTALRRRFSFKELAPNADLVPSAAHLIYNLLWRYEVNAWNSKAYKIAEAKVLEVTGTPDDFHTIKKDIWNQIRQEGNSGFDADKYFQGIQFSGLDPKELFITLNERIEILLNRDHCIGHSYFLSLAHTDDVLGELKKIFKDSILPLLQEYFYGDYGRIGMVLGEGFIKKKVPGSAGKKKFAKGSWGDDFELNEKTVFEFTDSSTWTVNTFKQVYAG